MKNELKDQIEDSEYKGDLKGFPKEVVEKMLERQFEQGNKKDVSIFEMDKLSVAVRGGFRWLDTSEGDDFWVRVVIYRNFDLFFEKYPKSENKEENPLKVEGQFITEGFPKRMRVWDDNKECANELIVLFESNDCYRRFTAIDKETESEYLEGNKFSLSCYKNAEELTTNTDLEKLKEQRNELDKKIKELEKQ